VIGNEQPQADVDEFSELTIEDLLPMRRKREARQWGDLAEPIDVLELDQGETSAGRATVLISQTDKGLLVTPSESASSALLSLRAGAFNRFNWRIFGESSQLLWHSDASPEVRLVDTDQLNHSIVVDERHLVKWQLLARPSAAVEKMRALQTSPALTPQLDAALTWQNSPTSQPCLVATVSRYLPGATDGWVWAVDLLRSYGQGEAVDPISPFERIGVMTAQMHAAFADLSKSHASRQVIQGWQSQALLELDEAKTKMADDPSRALWRHIDKIETAIKSFVPSVEATVITIHGDYHVGQILRDPDGQLFIIDFDGNPLTEPSDAQLLQPPTRDVASMYSAIDHVARVTLHRNKDVDHQSISSWVPRAQEVFLGAYKKELASLNLQELFEPSLMSLFTVQQEIREYLYAVQYLPHWVYVPDAALDAMFGASL
jgi:maltokinase